MHEHDNPGQGLQPAQNRYEYKEEEDMPAPPDWSSRCAWARDVLITWLVRAIVKEGEDRTA